MFARQPLWKVGLDYRHGTGHGIGHFLNIHEGTLSKTHLVFIVYSDKRRVLTDYGLMILLAISQILNLFPSG